MACELAPSNDPSSNEARQPSLTTAPRESCFVPGSRSIRGASVTPSVFRQSTFAVNCAPESPVVRNPSTTCCFCQKDFESVPYLQAHLRTQKHPSFNVSTTPGYRKSPTYHCTVCKSNINAHLCAQHLCLKEQRDKYIKSHELLQKEGLPTVCVLCSGFNCRSRPALICHLLCQHTAISRDFCCPICNDRFKSKDHALFAAHAMDVHVPEIALNYRKAAFETTTSSTTKKPWICLFPSKRYRNVKKYEIVKDCNCHMDTFVEYTCHMITMHTIMPLSLSNVDKDLICKPCKKVFDSSIKRKRHEKDYHFENIKLHYQVSSDSSILHRQYSPELTCLECYEQFESYEEVQSHIVSAHNTESWDVCGFCSRKYSFTGSFVNPAIVFAQMIKHEQHHTRQLDALDFYNHSTSKLEKEELMKILQSNYFATIELIDFKKKQSNKEIKLCKLSAKQLAWCNHIGVKNRLAQDLL